MNGPCDPTINRPVPAFNSIHLSHLTAKVDGKIEHYLRPMWSLDNIRKGKRMEAHMTPCLPM